MNTTSETPSKAVRRAGELAEEVFHPAALEVDQADSVPASHLNLLADEGFYGIAGPAELSSLAVEEMTDAFRIVEVLAGACLTTAFVWAQHHNAVMAATHSERPGIRETWLPRLCSGATRSALAMSAAVRPGPSGITAKKVDGGYAFDGEVPWISGWGLTDVLFTAARDADDMLVWALLDAKESATLRVRRAELAAVNASRTVTATFDRHFVPEERVTGLVPLEAWRERDPATLRFNGSFALGITARCCRLIGESPLDAELDARRRDLDEAPPEEVPAARAAAAELAYRAAGALTVATGSSSLYRDRHAQRLVREAAFLLVFGSRKAIKDELLGTLQRR
ncbi:acyl-CoA dehydrogenase family protein [Amycolatopsis minnesotensis]|uniref:Acyl-CoA dehydrogenase family protein n=1 Tax=Amycolatopsis minnesotensis TaxID=337894 RepID=A0ABP5BXM2_9PSEU